MLYRQALQAANSRITGKVGKLMGFKERVRESFYEQGFMHHLGATLDEVDAGTCSISVPANPNLTQQHGFFHGGVTATLADNAGGFAAYSLMSEDEQPLSVEFKINLLNKAEGDRLISRAKVIKNGKRLKISQVEVFADNAGSETLIAVALVTVIATRVTPAS